MILYPAQAKPGNLTKLSDAERDELHKLAAEEQAAAIIVIMIIVIIIVIIMIIKIIIMIIIMIMIIINIIIMIIIIIMIVRIRNIYIERERESAKTHHVTHGSVSLSADVNIC